MSSQRIKAQCSACAKVYVPADLARLERRADPITVVGHGSVDDAGITSPVDGSRAFLDSDIEPLQQRAQLPVGGTFVIAQARPHDGR